MYIIIHKYQRWSVNVETKQKYLKKYADKRNQNNISKYGSWVKGTVDLKPVLFVSLRRASSSDKSIKLICTLHVVFGKENVFNQHLQYGKGSGNNHY